MIGLRVVQGVFGAAVTAGHARDAAGRVLALSFLVHTLVTLPGSGWTAASAAGPVVVVVAGAAFVRHERRAASPLVPPDVVGSPAVASTLGILVAASAALHGTLFVATFLLQDTLGLDPLHVALLGLPPAALMIAAPPGRGAGARRTTVGAMGVMAAGVLLGAGFGTVMVAATHAVVCAWPSRPR